MATESAPKILISVLTAAALWAIGDSAPLSVASAQTGVSVDAAGITFPDGSVQSSAFTGAFGSPDEIFNTSCSVRQSTATSTGRCDLPKTVPAGKRLVIETVTGYGYAENCILGAAYLWWPVANGSDTGPMVVTTSFPWVTQENNSTITRRYFGFNHSGHLYVDGPRTLQFNVGGGSFQSNSDYSVHYSVSGYLVDIDY